MKILFASSEIFPFAKTGGLADVCGTLPVELDRLGHELTLFMPAYRGIERSGQPLEETGVELQVPIGSKAVRGSLQVSVLPGTNIKIYLVRQAAYFDRPAIYGDDKGDYPDNCERFVFFCRAVLESVRQLGLEIELAHVHDWPTALIPAYLKTEYADIRGYEQIASLMTVHNLAYQGRFWHWDMLLTGLDWKYFNWRQMEYHGELNLMKTGLVFADSLNTVSPRYAQEIQEFPLGCGLEGVLSHRSNVLAGITNGVDYSQWNPAKDPYLASHYDVHTFVDGKAACKVALQETMGLPLREDVPLIGLVGRLASQKGVDLAISLIAKWAAREDVQWVLLGTGDPNCEKQLRELSARHPDRVAARIGFSDPLAHQIEAGADIFLMPSRYEPCGLSQLYSLKYGAVPVVRETGGLADTVTDTTAETLAASSATGFCFREATIEALEQAVRRALDLLADATIWHQIVATGMQQDWSWHRSAEEYSSLYQQTVRRHRESVVAS